MCYYEGNIDIYKRYNYYRDWDQILSKNDALKDDS